MPEIFSGAIKKTVAGQPVKKTEPARASSSMKKTASDPKPVVEKKHRHVDDYSQTMKAEVACTDPLAAYAPKPTDVTFSSQAATEHIILLIRQHPITQVPWVISVIGLAFVPLLFSFNNALSFFPPTYSFAFMLFWYLLLTGFALESFLKWFYNVYIITDERIIDVDFVSLIYKNVSSAKIDNIEDVTATSGGFFAALFDYGKVTVQTAAEKREFEFDAIPHPNKVVALINELILEEEREKLEGRVS